MNTLPFTDFWPLFGTYGLRAGINRRNFIVLRLHAAASCDADPGFFPPQPKDSPLLITSYTTTKVS